MCLKLRSYESNNMCLYLRLHLLSTQRVCLYRTVTDAVYFFVSTIVCVRLDEVYMCVRTLLRNPNPLRK